MWSGASHLALFDCGDEEMEKKKRLIKSHIQIMWHTQFTLLTSSHGYRSIDNADCRLQRGKPMKMDINYRTVLVMSF